MAKYSDLYFTTQANGNVKGYMYYYDAQGKRKQISKTSKLKKKKDAKAELRAWANELQEQAKNSLSLGNKMIEKTVEEVLTDYLNYQLERGILEKSSHHNQMGNLNRYIAPYIGDIPFDELNKDAIEVWITKLHEEGLKQGTIHGAYSQLAKVYKYWWKQGQLRINPFEFVDTPSSSAKRKTFLGAQQLERLFACLNEQYEVEDALYVAVELAALAGLRRGEICALRWYDVDLAGGMLNISSAIGVANGTYTKGPKNKSSIRSFPIVQQLIDVLQAKYDSVKEKYGTVEPGWFVCGDTIHYLSPTHLSRLFKQFVDRNELVDYYLEPVKLHSLRHNFATMGVNSHMDIASLSRMMGHASKAMTLDTYASDSPEAMKLAKDTLQGSLEATTEFLELPM